MYNPSELSVTYTPSRRWVNIALFSVIAIVGVVRLYEGITDSRTPITLMGAAIIVLAIFGMLQMLRYRVIFTEGYVEQQSIFGSKRLMWTEILQAKERKRMLVLYGPTQHLMIRHDIERREDVNAKIAAKLNALPVLRTSESLHQWGIADRDSEGRLIRS